MQEQQQEQLPLTFRVYPPILTLLTLGFRSMFADAVNVVR